MDLTEKQIEDHKAWLQDQKPAHQAYVGVLITDKLTAALAEKDDGGWKPIETAPKDGSMILICLPRQGRLILRARFDPIHKHWLYDYQGEGGISRSTSFHEGDLWQPLPPLPLENT